MKQIDINNLPDDPAVLKQIIIAQQKENAAQQKQIELCLEQIELLKHKVFGKSSERHTSQEEELQGRLFDIPEVEEPEDEDVSEDASDDDEILVPEHKRAKPGRKPLPAHLPRVDVVHDIPEEEKVCPCGCQLTCIGADESERLCHKPAEVYVELHKRLKYACRECEGTEDDGPTVKISPLVPTLIPKSIATPSLLAYILVSKFVDALPFYRQEKIFARQNIDMNRTTMCNWAMKVASACEPLLEALSQEIRSGPLINIDETKIQVLKEAGRSPTTDSFMWVRVGGVFGRPGIIFTYAPSRGSEVAEQLLAGYQGIVQSDGYKGYDFLKKIAGIIHAGCFAHIRRKFMDVLNSGKKKGAKRKKTTKYTNANKAVDYIKKLYSIEKKLRNAELAEDEFLSRREKLARPVVDDFKKFLDELKPKVPKDVLLGKAVNYALDEWEKATKYLEYSFMKPDNNIVENAIRPFVVGRKNWLFSGHAKGAEASATIYSLIETAKANNLEPFKYLNYIFEKIPFAKTAEDYKALLPMYLSPEVL